MLHRHKIFLDAHWYDAPETHFVRKLAASRTAHAWQQIGSGLGGQSASAAPQLAAALVPASPPLRLPPSRNCPRTGATQAASIVTRLPIRVMRPEQLSALNEITR